MKTKMILAALLLVAFGTMKAQNQAPTEVGKNVNTVVVNATGDVTIRQSDQYVALWDSEHERHVTYNMADTAVYLDGTADFDVTLHELNHLTLLSSGDVKSSCVLKGKDLSVTLTGSGDVTLDLDYDNVHVLLLGSGDVELRGKCNTLVSQGSGSGDLDIQHLQCGDKREMKENMPDMASFTKIMAELGENMEQLADSVDWEKFEQDMEKWAEKMEKWGSRMEKWGEHVERKYNKDYDYSNDYEYYNEYINNLKKHEEDKPKDKRPEKKNLLLDANWNGFEAGLNMLFTTPVDVVNSNNGAQGMEIKPLRSWYFGFNIADVGIAFNRRHTAGLFTGVGIGWNNFSWNNDVAIEYDPDNVVCTLVPIEEDKIVKNSKYGALFLEVPLMFEIRPTRKMYIDAGVTGGLRFAQWNRVKFADGTRVKHYHGAPVDGLNLFKLDASLRVGGNSLGFFANYALLPIFKTNMVKVHPVIFGFSINF